MMADSKKLRGHEESRHVVCATCHERNHACILVSAITEAQIREHVFQGYDRACTTYPDGLCPSCAVALRKAKKKVSDPQKKRWEALKWDELRPPSGLLPCDCGICDVARFCHKNKKPKLDITKEEVAAEKALPQSSICPECFQNCGKGIDHPCGPRAKIANLTKIVNGLTVSGRDQVD